jgi:beta-lactamase regulating signal transducer with metallopeptidase domain
MNLTDALGWALLHFLWQGAAVAGLLAGALAMLRHAGARARYSASCAAMLLMLVLVAATFTELKLTSGPPDTTVSVAIPHADGATHGVSQTGAVPQVEGFFPAMVWTWLAGVIALSVRAIGGWAMAERFARRHTSRAEAAWDERFAILARRLRVSRPVRLAVSALAQVPAVIGWARPVVLIPASVFTGLSAEQIEALPAHELAHVRRNDYLVNLLQTAAETLLFYHPAVWWVNRRIRDERENCCDDLAVETCGNKLAYIRALTDLEQRRGSTPKFAMAADGGSLLGRVQRLLGAKPGAITGPSSWIACIGILAALMVTGVTANGLAQRAVPGGAENAALLQENADVVQQNAEIEQQSADAAKRNTEIAERTANIERLNRQMTEIQRSGEMQQLKKQIALIEAEVRRRAEAEADPQEAGTALRSGQMQRLKAEVAQLEAVQQQQTATLQQQKSAAQPGWLEGIQAEGFRNLSVDQLIRLKENGVTADYIRQIRAAGLQPNSDELVRLRENGVTPAFIKDVKQMGYKDLTINDAIRLREHGASPDWIRQVQSLGYPNVSLNDVIRLREQGLTPEAIRDARNRFKDLTINQLIRLKESGIL